MKFVAIKISLLNFIYKETLLGLYKDLKSGLTLLMLSIYRAVR